MDLRIWWGLRDCDMEIAGKIGTYVEGYYLVLDEEKRP